MGTFDFTFRSADKTYAIQVSCASNKTPLKRDELNDKVKKAASQICGSCTPTETIKLRINKDGTISHHINTKWKKIDVSTETKSDGQLLETLPSFPKFEDIQKCQSPLAVFLQNIANKIKSIIPYFKKLKEEEQRLSLGILKEIVGEIPAHNTLSMRNVIQYWIRFLEKSSLPTIENQIIREELTNCSRRCAMIETIQQKKDLHETASIIRSTTKAFATEIAALNEGSKMLLPCGYWKESAKKEYIFQDILLEVTKTSDDNYTISSYSTDSDVPSFSIKDLSIENIQNHLPLILARTHRSSIEPSHLKLDKILNLGAIASAFIKKKPNQVPASTLIPTDVAALKELYSFGSKIEISSVNQTQSPYAQPGQVAQLFLKEKGIISDITLKKFQNEFELLLESTRGDEWKSSQEMRETVTVTARKLLKDYENLASQSTSNESNKTYKIATKTLDTYRLKLLEILESTSHGPRKISVKKKDVNRTFRDKVGIRSAPIRPGLESNATSAISLDKKQLPIGALSSLYNHEKTFTFEHAKDATLIISSLIENGKYEEARQCVTDILLTAPLQTQQSKELVAQLKALQSEAVKAALLVEDPSSQPISFQLAIFSLETLLQMAMGTEHQLHNNKLMFEQLKNHKLFYCSSLVESNRYKELENFYNQQSDLQSSLNEQKRLSNDEMDYLIASQLIYSGFKVLKGRGQKDSINLQELISTLQTDPSIPITIQNAHDKLTDNKNPILLKVGNKKTEIFLISSFDSSQKSGSHYLHTAPASSSVSRAAIATAFSPFANKEDEKNFFDIEEGFKSQGDNSTSETQFPEDARKQAIDSLILKDALYAIGSSDWRQTTGDQTLIEENDAIQRIRQLGDPVTSSLNKKEREAITRLAVNLDAPGGKEFLKEQLFSIVNSDMAYIITKPEISPLINSIILDPRLFLADSKTCEKLLSLLDRRIAVLQKEIEGLKNGQNDKTTQELIDNKNQEVVGHTLLKTRIMLMRSEAPPPPIESFSQLLSTIETFKTLPSTLKMYRYAETLSLIRQAFPFGSLSESLKDNKNMPLFQQAIGRWIELANSPYKETVPAQFLAQIHSFMLETQSVLDSPNTLIPSALKEAKYTNYPTDGWVYKSEQNLFISGNYQINLTNGVVIIDGECSVKLPSHIKNSPEVQSLASIIDLNQLFTVKKSFDRDSKENITVYSPQDNEHLRIVVKEEQIVIQKQFNGKWHEKTSIGIAIPIALERLSELRSIWIPIDTNHPLEVIFSDKRAPFNQKETVSLSKDKAIRSVKDIDGNSYVSIKPSSELDLFLKKFDSRYTAYEAKDGSLKVVFPYTYLEKNQRHPLEVYIDAHGTVSLSQEGKRVECLGNMRSHLTHSMNANTLEKLKVQLAALPFAIQDFQVIATEPEKKILLPLTKLCRQYEGTNDPEKSRLYDLLKPALEDETDSILLECVIQDDGSLRFSKLGNAYLTYLALTQRKYSDAEYLAEQFLLTPLIPSDSAIGQIYKAILSWEDYSGEAFKLRSRIRLSQALQQGERHDILLKNIIIDSVQCCLKQKKKPIETEAIQLLQSLPKNILFELEPYLHDQISLLTEIRKASLELMSSNLSDFLQEITHTDKAAIILSGIDDEAKKQLGLLLQLAKSDSTSSAQDLILNLSTSPDETIIRESKRFFDLCKKDSKDPSREPLLKALTLSQARTQEATAIKSLLLVALEEEPSEEHSSLKFPELKRLGIKDIYGLSQDISSYNPSNDIVSFIEKISEKANKRRERREKELKQKTQESIESSDPKLDEKKWVEEFNSLLSKASTPLQQGSQQSYSTTESSQLFQHTFSASNDLFEIQSKTTQPPSVLPEKFSSDLGDQLQDDLGKFISSELTQEIRLKDGISLDNLIELEKTATEVQKNIETTLKTTRELVTAAIYKGIDQDTSLTSIETRNQKIVDRLIGAYIRGSEQFQLAAEELGWKGSNEELERLEGMIEAFIEDSIKKAHINDIIRSIHTCSKEIQKNNSVSADESKKLYTLLQAERAYTFDPKNNFTRYLLGLEYMNGFIIRKQNIDLVKEVLENQNGTFQLPPGSGKTLVVTRLLAAAKVDYTHIPTLIVPEFLYEGNLKDLDEGLRQLFGQHVFAFDIPMDTSLSSERIDFWINRIESTIKSGGVMVTTRRSLETLRNLFDDLELKIGASEFQDPETQKKIEQYKKLGSLLVLLKEKMACHIDEVDSILDIHQEVNRSVGERSPISQEKRDACQDIFVQINELALKGDSFAVKLLSNTHVDTTAESRQEFIKRLAQKFLEKNNIQVSKENIAYFSTGMIEGTTDKWPQFMEILRSSKNEDDQKKFRQYASAKAIISEVLQNSVLPKAQNVKDGYGRHKDGWKVGPYLNPGEPLEGSEFSTDLELLAFTYLDYLQSGVSDTQAHELFEILGSPIQTDTGDTINASSAQELKKQINEKPALKLWLIKHHVAPKLSYVKQQVKANAFDLVAMAHSTSGMTGTPYNYATYHPGIDTSKAVKKGADGQTLYAIAKHSAEIKVVTIDNESDLLTHAIKSEKDGIIDAGVYCRDTNSLDLSEKACHALKDTSFKYVIFVDENGAKKTRTVEDGKVIDYNPKEHTHENSFTIYQRFIGVDIKQKSNAKFSVSVGNALFIKDFIQAVMRLRELSLNQSFDIVLTNDVAAVIRSITEKGEAEDLTIEDIIAYCVQNQQESVKKDTLEAHKMILKHIPKQSLFEARIKWAAERVANDNRAIFDTLQNLHSNRSSSYHTMILEGKAEGVEADGVEYEQLAQIRTKTASTTSLSSLTESSINTLNKVATELKSTSLKEHFETHKAKASRELEQRQSSYLEESDKWARLLPENDISTNMTLGSCTISTQQSQQQSTQTTQTVTQQVVTQIKKPSTKLPANPEKYIPLFDLSKAKDSQSAHQALLKGLDDPDKFLAEKLSKDGEGVIKDYRFGLRIMHIKDNDFIHCSRNLYRGFLSAAYQPDLNTKKPLDYVLIRKIGDKYHLYLLDRTDTQTFLHLYDQCKDSVDNDSLTLVSLHQVPPQEVRGKIPSEDDPQFWKLIAFAKLLDGQASFSSASDQIGLLEVLRNWVDLEFTDYMFPKQLQLLTKTLLLAATEEEIREIGLKAQNKELTSPFTELVGILNTKLKNPDHMSRWKEEFKIRRENTEEHIPPEEYILSTVCAQLGLQPPAP